MSKKINVINPISGEPMQKASNVLVYGLTDEQLVFVNDNLPNSNISVTDCSDCFTDIITTACIAVIMNPDLLVDENIAYFNEFANEVGVYSEKIIFTKPHPILDGLNKNVRCTIFQDDYEFVDKIKFILLEASRSEKSLILTRIQLRKQFVY